MTPPPIEAGTPVADLDTPALLVELAPFERNLERMSREAAKFELELRPHAKTHKSPDIVLRQMALGAVGCCCQTVFEAETLAAGGVGDILVSNQVIGKRKTERLAHLARRVRLGVCVDDAANIDELDRAAGTAGSRLDVLVEIDVGMGRCGVAPGAPALTLAGRVVDSANLVLRGLQAYHGAAQHIRDYEQRRAAIQQAAELARQTAALWEASGVPCQTVTGAGTGSYRFEAASGVYSELQAGSYVFMDDDYARNRMQGDAAFHTFEHSLFVLTSVISTAAADRAVVDAGLKAVSVDSGLPSLPDFTDMDYVGASDEHGKIDLRRSDRRLALGQKIRLLPGHCDPTVNLHDWLIGVRDGRVETCWPIAARGYGPRR